MSVVVYDGKIAFQTSRKLVKLQQLMENPQVALCLDNIQMTGIAQIKGHPFDEKAFLALYRQRHKSSYETYSHMASNCVVEIEPKAIKLWKYQQKEPYIVELDAKKKEMRLKSYAHGKTD